jgi:hypothetical protein
MKFKMYFSILKPNTGLKVQDANKLELYREPWSN